jgi:hypothetical protein
MTVAAVFARVKEVMDHDWEAEYHAVRAANGGRNPGYKPIQWEKCWERGVCPVGSQSSSLSAAAREKPRGDI